MKTSGGVEFGKTSDRRTGNGSSGEIVAAKLRVQDPERLRQVVGFVDLGELGVADRWGDVAVAKWSVTWNLGTGWEQQFLKAYAVEADPGRMAIYRLLYDLV